MRETRADRRGKGLAGRLLGATLWAVLCLSPGESLGAEPARFARLSVEHGLSQNTVLAVLQDHVGFLWFGTEEGLNRYDGRNFVTFKHRKNDPGSLPDNLVSALLEDRDQQLWVGTGSGLCLFDRQSETFQTLVATRGTTVQVVLQAADGTIWIGTEGGGLYKREARSRSVYSYRHDPKDPHSLAHDAIRALTLDHDGRLWIGTMGGGLDLLEPGHDGFQHFRHDPQQPASLSHDEVWGLAEDAGGALWIATYGGGLNVRDPGSGRFRVYRHHPEDPRSLRTDLLTCALLDRAGTLWIGSNRGGLHRYDAASDGFESFVHDPSNPFSLSHDIIRTLHQDAQDRLWVGTFTGGVNLLRRQHHEFGYWSHRPGDAASLSDPSVSALLEDRNGRLWIGTEGGGLNRLDLASGRMVRYRYPSEMPGGPALLSLLQDRRGQIWIGTYREGLGRFDPEQGTFVTGIARQGPPSDGGTIWALGEAPDGMLWLGSNRGLERFDPVRRVVLGHEEPSAPELGPRGVRTMLWDHAGNLWVGGMGGLNLLRQGGEGFVHFRHEDANPSSLSHDWVVSLLEDPAGGMWVGTYGGGLNRLDTSGRFTAYKEAQGLPSDVVYGIERDASGRLWLSTNRGLSRFDPVRERFENFDLTNGLESLQFHMGASLKSRAGRLLFGSVDGFYLFDPEAIRSDEFRPPVVFTGLRLLSGPARLPQAVSTLDEVSLSPEEKALTLEFAALDFSVPRRNRFAYQLQGFNEQWVDIGERREATFTNLEPGRYSFKVKAANSDGVWNDRPAVLRIVIQPPLWKTAWFRSAAAALLVLCLFSAHRLRVRHMRRRERELTLRVEDALGRLRVLRGLLPICAWCKKVRDDQGYWNQIESYLRSHTEADFSHGICPDCADKLQPGSGQALRAKNGPRGV